LKILKAHIGAVLLALAVAACSPSGPQGAYINRGNGGEPKSLDPHHIDGTWEANIDGDLFEGLVAADAAGRPIPGMATDWTTSPDGLTWTFHLRKALWSDGVPVTAQDFVFGWERLLAPENAAPYAYNMWVVKNARAISDGKLPPSALGVSAPDKSTLVVHLEHPAPYLPELLIHQTAVPVPRHLVVKLGNAWSQQRNIVSNGAYMVKEWVPNDHVTLVKNPHYYEAARVHIETVRYFDTTDSQAALMEFRGRQIDTQNPFPALAIDWMHANIPRAIRSVPYLGTDYLAINIAHKPLDDIRVREALNLAYNREVIAGKIRRIGELPAYSLIPPGVANYPNAGTLDFKPLPYSARVAKARALMEAVGYGSQHRLHLIYLTSTNPDQRRTAALVQQMLSQVYIDMTIRSVELQILYSRMQQHDFDIANAVWIADFNDASNFLDLLRTGGDNNYGNYSNPRFDALLDQAQLTIDPKKRGQIMQQAEDIALADYAWVPCYYQVTDDIVQPWVKGWIPNLLGFNRSRWLSIEGRP
jgi:oligopeptide transport system substrate-binding protein